MDSFKHFISEGWFSRSRRPVASPEERQQHQQQFKDQEDQDFQAELAKFKKAVEDFAHDPSSTRDQLLVRMKGQRRGWFSDRDPLYTAVHFRLPDTDYATINNNPQLKAKYQGEVEEIMQHALQWFDAIKPNVQQKPDSFDWQHEKDLVRRRANYASRKSQTPATIRGPWAYPDEQGKATQSTRKPRRPAKEN